MKILCGLGNPGDAYTETRHNAGFLFLDAFAEQHDFPDFKEKWKALVSEGEYNGEKLLLLKPLSFMNLSGEVLARFVNFYKLDGADVCLIYDDVDLKLGDFRFRSEGGPGTHNGMKSVIQHLGGPHFPRLRLGIESRGSFAPEQMDLSDFVLSRFSDEEWEVFSKMIGEARLYLAENYLA